ncbi:MAG TPA: type II secretion system F family protein [Gemmatimonadales bacterium]|nr:type II secretion system F family protein [Gemmatimonadales bacterium]
MLYLIAVLVGLAVTGSIMLVVQLVPAESEPIRRLEEMEEGHLEVQAKRRREERSRRLQELLENLGARVEGGRSDLPEVRQFLIHAGYTSPTAVPIYLGTRVLLGAILAGIVLTFIPLLGLPPLGGLFGAVWGLLLGWTLPVFVVGGRVKKRQKEMVKALPDALDLLVVCVEAGLALNQALVRVSEEITNVSPVLGEQIALTNLEIRAGTPREDALRNFGERTGVEDIRSFVAMLIQTDRFGTSIAQALRTHADVLRTKRRQRAEEASAKTAIKMLFPLVFFIFPAMFVVILGPAVIQVYETLSKTF